MIEEQIRTWLDDNNKALISEIEKSIPVRFTQWEEDHYSCQLHKNEIGDHIEAEIFYKEPLAQAKIAHELLHAKVGYTFGDNYIMYTVSDKHVFFSYMLKNEFASGILNACEHIIFFKDYLEMGYNEEDCFEPTANLDDSIRELDKLVKKGLKEKGHYSSEKVAQYLGLAFSFIFYPNFERFKKQVEMLKKIDFPLFSRFRNLRDACCNLDIIPENKEFIQNAYYKFAFDMNKWFTNAFKGAVITGV